MGRCAKLCNNNTLVRNAAAGFSIVSILEERSPQLNLQAPVPEEGLGRLGVLSQRKCLKLGVDNLNGLSHSYTVTV